MSATTTATSTQPLSRTRTAKGIDLRQALVLVFLITGLTMTLVPFIWLYLSSFKTGTEMVRVPPTFFPEQFTLENYARIFGDKTLPLGRIYLNSIVVSVANVITTLFTSSLLGFLFAKYEFPGKNLLFGYFLVSMMIPGQVTMIPNYLILVQFKLINTLWALILLSFLNAFGIFMMRQFIVSLPDELLDAARIDGASEWQIYWRIVVPQLGSSLATLGILVFMSTWNAYLWPLVVITDIETRTLPVILTWFSSQHGVRPQLVMAATVLVISPILVVYAFFQRWIVRGFTMSGFK